MGVHATLDAFDAMIKNLNSFKDLQEELIKNLKKSYEQIGQVWDDEKYKQFGEYLAPVYKAGGDSYIAMSDCVSRMNVLRKSLEDYLNS
ncbi:MAG: hypothetical protein K6D97_02380 [Clostridia bacterium]|nr:hypothetical protein [Clostridia bacterium]